MTKWCVVCGVEFDGKGGSLCCSGECSEQRRSDKQHENYLKSYHDPEKRNRICQNNSKWRSNNKKRLLILTNEWRRIWLLDPTNQELNRKRKRERHRKWIQNPEHRETHQMRTRETMRKLAHASPATQKFFLSMKLGEAVNQTTNHNMKDKNAESNQPQKSLNQQIQKWIEGFTSKLRGIEESCQELAAIIDANPNASPSIVDQIVEADHRFSYNMLESMRKVGKGELYCELLFDPSLAARKLLPLPPVEQRKLYNEPIQIVKNVGGKNTGFTYNITLTGKAANE